MPDSSISCFQRSFAKAEDLHSLELAVQWGPVSKGMKMKPTISAALSHHSKLLILDETTSGLEKIADYIVLIDP